MKKIGIHIISFYQTFLRGFLSSIGISSSCCFTPTCSEYAKQAIERYGLLKGSWMGMKRILRCWGCHTYSHDPVN